MFSEIVFIIITIIIALILGYIFELTIGFLPENVAYYNIKYMNMLILVSTCLTMKGLYGY